MKRTTIFLGLITLGLALHVSCSRPEADPHPWVKDVGARTLPAGEQVWQVTDYGAVGTGTGLQTRAIQDALDACAKAGGGIVTFAPGDYLTGSLFVGSGVTLHIPEGVTLWGSTELEDYPEIDTRVAGIEMRWPAALINVIEGKNVQISGKGTIHAQGKVFWDSYWAMRKEYEARGLRWIVDYDCKRPRTLLVSDATDVTIKDVTIKQAGFWTIQLLYSSYCTVDNVTIQNNIDGHGPSTDGIDIDSSSWILVENCDIDCNDDNFCLKSGRDADGLRINRPTEYVVIRNCISRAGGGLLTCGSETSGGIRYVVASGLKAKGTYTALRLKSALTRGGTTEHIYFEDIEIEDVTLAIEATLNWNPAYSYSALPEEFEGEELPAHWYKMLEKVEPERGIPYFNDIYYTNVKIKNAKRLFNIEGIEESQMQRFHFKSVEATAENGGVINWASDWTVDDVNITTAQPIKITNSSIPGLDPGSQKHSGFRVGREDQLDR